MAQAKRKTDIFIDIKYFFIQKIRRYTTEYAKNLVRSIKYCSFTFLFSFRIKIFTCDAHYYYPEVKNTLFANKKKAKRINSCPLLIVHWSVSCSDLFDDQQQPFETRRTEWSKSVDHNITIEWYKVNACCVYGFAKNCL